MTDAHAVKKSATKKDWIWKLLLSGTCLAPLSLSAAQVEGTIVDADSEWPLAHASVAVSTGKAGTITDSLGRYELELPPGRYRVEVSRIGYGTQSRQIELLAGQNLQLDFALNAQALPQAATLITATGRPKSAATLTVPVAIVPREAIELSNAENVAGLLEDVAGLNVHSSLYGYLGSPSGVMIQGIDPKRVLILVDGERVIGGPGGVIDLSKLPVCNVERIEVVQGPHSALYGSEAMGGVVHILTRSPQEKQSGDVRFSLGSGGLTSLEGQAALTRSSLSASLTASRTALEALDRSPDDPDTDIDAYTQRFTQGKLRWEARPNLLLQSSARWLSQNEEGVSSQYFAPLDKTYVWRFPDQMQRVDLGAGAEWQWAEGSTANADVFRTYFDNLSREELIGSRQARDRSTDNVLTKYQLRTTHLLRRTHILTAGLEHTREELEVTLERTLPLGEQQHTVEVPPSRVDVAEAYIQDDWQVAENTGVVWGARSQWHSRYGFHLTPKISFAQRLSESLRVRASYGAGYRAPSLKERYFIFDHSNLGYKVLGTPSLSPERTWGLNVGAEFAPMEALDLRVNYFHNRLRNLIQTVSVAIYAYDNVGRATTRGIEFGLSAQLGDRLAVNGGYTYLRARDQDSQRDLPGRPRHALRVRAKWTTPGQGRIEVKWHRDSAVWADAEGTLRSPAGEEWDLNAEQPLWGSFALRLGIENLLDNRRDLDHPGDLRSLRGRAVRGGLRVQL
ncbi:MAG: TonB-dependent receptor [Candidatus Latescibacteria bacterium]|nr:TonB-dependent receptor [Candidatus Latescibacterota bacterium]